MYSPNLCLDYAELQLSCPPYESRRQLRPQLVETFDIHYFEHSEADEKEDETDSADPTSKYYINLPYTTVVLRVDTQEGQSDNKKVVFEQIHTATREILFSRAR